MAIAIVSFITTILAVLIVVLGIIYAYFKLVLYTYWKKRGVVHDDPIVPVGNLGPVVLGKVNAGEVYQDLYNRYKKHRYFGSYTFFVPNLSVTDPDLIRLILTKEFSHFHDRNMFSNDQIDPLTGHLFLMKGQKWKNLRVKLSPTFTSGKMKMMFNVVKDCGTELDNYLKEQRGTDVDIKEIFARYTTDSIMSTAFGVKCNSLRNPNCEFRYWGKKVFEPKPFWNAVFIFAPKVLDTLKIPYFERDLTAFFVKVFQETFKYRMSENSKVKRDFLDLLVQLINDGYVEDDDGNKPNIADSADGKLTVLESVAQAFVFFLAGFETSSTTATFCLFELAQNQDIQEKLRNEMKRVIQTHGDITYDSLNEMPYLHKVVSETLRKYPIVMFLNRLCTKEIDLPTTNLRIEKGTDILIPVLGLHRDPEYYPDPEKFDPERFNEENIAARHPYAYLPFGEGPRICIGMRFGFMQTKLAVINAVMSHKVTLSPSTKLPLVVDPGSFVYSPLDPIYLNMAPA